MKTNHIHKLKRHVYKTGAKTYFCTLDCTFRVACELALGKHAICWRCGKEFALNSYSITLAKPHCEECHIHKSESSKTKLRRKDDPIVENVTKQIGSAVIGSLRERLDKIAHGVSVANDSAKNENPKVEYKTLEEEDEFL